MFRSRIVVLSLLALAQQFTAANALAQSGCVGTTQQPGSTNNCPDGGGGDGPPPPPPPPGKPDLVPSISKVSFGGGKVAVLMTIGNLGQTTSGGTKMRIELFERELLGFALAPFHTQDVPVSGVQPSATLTLTAEAGVAAGGFFNRRNNKVCVTADAESEVVETNETNNKACKEVRSPLTHLFP